MMMQTIPIADPANGPRPNAAVRSQVLAIGEFDGVHLGHREVIRRTVETARRLGIPAAIMTFHPHPREVLGNGVYSRLLTPLKIKQAILESLGVDILYVVDFSEDFMRVSPRQFVHDMLCPMKVNTVFVGFDFTFGHRGAGTPDTLCELAEGRFAVEVVRPYHLGGVKVSSTLIREQLLSGRVEEANKLLGRRYSVAGSVVHGDGRGRTIGFPTANVSVADNYLIPANGVYAVQARLKDGICGGVMNIGVKPTFAESLPEPTLEVHLFDFDRNIYDEPIEVELIAYIRSERKFASAAELIEQIRRDADQARTMLA